MAGWVHPGLLLRESPKVQNQEAWAGEQSKLQEGLARVESVCVWGGVGDRGAGRQLPNPGGKAAGWDHLSIRLGPEVAQVNPGYILVTNSQDTQARMWPGPQIL